LAEFKGEIINSFVSDNQVDSVIEFGCGDGNQLTYLQLKKYLGLDISPKIVKACREKFDHDSTKKFEVLSDYKGEKSHLVLSLDVIFHLVEDQTYEEYMNRLFKASERFVMIYASNFDNDMDFEPHVKHRKFTRWIESERPEFALIQHIENRYPYDKNNSSSTSYSDFYIFRKREG